MTAPTALETPAKRLDRFAAHRDQLAARRRSILADLDDVEADRQAALLAGGDTVDLARRARDLRGDLDAVDADLAEVRDWIGQVQAEIETQRRAAEHERAVHDLADAERNMATWAAGAAARAEEDRAVVLAAADRRRVDLATGAALRDRVNAARQRVHGGTAAVPADPIDQVVQTLRDHPARHRQFLAGRAPRRADWLASLTEDSDR